MQTSFEWTWNIDVVLWSDCIRKVLDALSVDKENKITYIEVETVEYQINKLIFLT